MKIKIGIAEDQVLFRKGILELIAGFKNMKPVLEAENGKILLEKLRGLKNNFPDILLLDIEMPVLNGIETLPVLKKEFPKLKIIILSGHDEPQVISKLMELGANGYLLKNAFPKEVEEALLAVYKNDYYINNHTLIAMQNGLRKKVKSKLIPANLTKRELEVLKLICMEYKNAEMAKSLFISERTIEGHRNNLLNKTGAKSTAGLVIFAIKHHLYDVI